MKTNCAINIFGFRAGQCGIKYSRAIGTTTYNDIQYSGKISDDENPYSLSRTSKIQIGSLTKRVSLVHFDHIIKQKKQKWALNIKNKPTIDYF